MLPEPENLNHDSSHPAFETVGTAKPAGNQDPSRGPFVGEMRDLSPRDLARALRTALGLPPKDQRLAEQTAGHRRHLPGLIRTGPRDDSLYPQGDRDRCSPRAPYSAPRAFRGGRSSS